MSKVIKCIIAGIITTFILGSFVGCGNSEAAKAVEKGKELVNEKEYDKALVSFDMALDSDPRSKEAKSLKEMIEDYLDAEKAFKSGDLNRAQVKIEAIGNKDDSFEDFKKSVAILEKSIEKKEQFDKDLKNDIEKLNKLIDEKNFEEAKRLCKSIEGRQLDEGQKQSFDKIKLRLAAELGKAGDKTYIKDLDINNNKGISTTQNKRKKYLMTSMQTLKNL